MSHFDPNAWVAAGQPAKPFRIIPCNEWGAMPPRHAISVAGRFDKAIFHHTAGHSPNIDHQPGESYADAQGYARAIQRAHMSPSPTDPSKPWNDTGNNFLVARSGHIFEGRHRSLELLMSGQCPVSAHCPGQNGNPGVEIEHYGNETMTPIQWDAALWLFTLICREGGFKADRIYGHKDFWSTSCPGPLYANLPAFRAQVNSALNPAPPKPAGYKTRPWFGAFAIWWLQGQDPDTRPSSIPAKVPQGAFRTLDQIITLAKEKP